MALKNTVRKLTKENRKLQKQPKRSRSKPASTKSSSRSLIADSETPTREEVVRHAVAIIKPFSLSDRRLIIDEIEARLRGLVNEPKSESGVPRLKKLETQEKISWALGAGRIDLDDVPDDKAKEYLAKLDALVKDHPEWSSYAIDGSRCKLKLKAFQFEQRARETEKILVLAKPAVHLLAPGRPGRTRCRFGYFCG